MPNPSIAASIPLVAASVPPPSIIPALFVATSSALPAPFAIAPPPALAPPALAPIVAPPAVLAPSFPEPEIIHAPTPVSLFSQLLPFFLSLIIIFSLLYLITSLIYLHYHSPLVQYLSAFFFHSFFLFC